MNKKVAIVGLGWVGKAMHALFPDAVIYDPAYYRVTNEETEEVSYQLVGVPMSTGYTYTKLDNKEEINKCDVLCENCHRELHYKSKQK